MQCKPIGSNDIRTTQTEMSKFNYAIKATAAAAAATATKMPSNRKNAACTTCHWQRDQIFKSKSVLKKRKATPASGAPQLYLWCITVVLFTLPYLSECELYPTRDPRWYSREGDYNYPWPNPGDTDYR